MADPSEFPDLGDFVPIHRKKLMELVAKTPMKMGEFEKLLGWDFIGNAPAKKKELAWAVLNSSKEDLKLISECRAAFPQAYITEIRDVAPGSICPGVGVARSDGGS